MSQVIVLVCIVLAAVVMFRRARHFGGLRTSFVRELSEDRKRLTAARKTTKRAEASMNAEFATAQKAVTTAQLTQDGRIAAAEAALTSLTNPGPGARVCVIGPVGLFEHVLLINGTEHPLAGLSSATQLTSGSALLTVQLPSGHTLVERFDTAERTSAPTYTTKSQGDWDVLESSQRVSRDYSEDQIVKLSLAINNQVLAHQEFLANAPALIPEAELAVQRERSNTVDLDQAKAHFAGLELGSDAKRAVAEAQLVLTQVEQQYGIAVAAANSRRQAARLGADGLPAPRWPRVATFAVVSVVFAGAAVALLLVPMTSGFFGVKVSAYEMYREGFAGEVVGQLIGAGACAMAALVFLVMAIAAGTGAAASVRVDPMPRPA